MLSIMIISGTSGIFCLELGRLKMARKKKEEENKNKLIENDNEEGKELEDK